MFWLLGSFSGVRWPEFQLVIVVVLAGLAVCLWYARALDAFTFGDDAAASLGIAVPRVRLILFTTAALITATIVSMAGSIGFCWHGGAARDAFLLWPAAPNVADRQRAGRGDIDGTGGHCVAPADCPAKSARWGSNRPVGVPFFAVIIYRSRNK